MSIKSFKSSPDAAINGVWFEYPTNKDKTIPRFKLARMSKQNKEYAKLLRQKIKPHQRSLELEIMSDDEQDAIFLEVFVDRILLGWEHIQPNDDGVEIDFNRENALKLLSDPEWQDLYDDLYAKAAKAAGFRGALDEAEAKN